MLEKRFILVRLYKKLKNKYIFYIYNKKYKLKINKNMVRKTLKKKHNKKKTIISIK